MTFNLNAIAVRGLIPALHEAAAIWEGKGAPAPTEGQRANIRDLVQQEKPNVNFAREAYRMIVHWTGEAQYQAAQLARNAEQNRIRDQRRAKKQAMTSEMKALRESLGLSQAEMNVKLNLKPNVVNNAENPNGSYSNDFVESLLRRFRVEAKLAGKIGGALAAKAQPKQPAMAAVD